MTSLADVLFRASPELDLGGLALEASDITVKQPLILRNGSVTGWTTIRPPKDGTFTWDGLTAVAPPGPSRAVVAVLGGSCYMSNLQILGGQCLGQLTVGLDQNRMADGSNVPCGVTIDTFAIAPNSRADSMWSTEKLHAIYVNTTAGGRDQAILFRNGQVGPCEGGGPVIKVGGDGGANGVTFDNVNISPGLALAADQQLPRSILVADAATNITFRNCTSDAPSQIEVIGGAQVTFKGCRFAPGTKVLVKVTKYITVFGRRFVYSTTPLRRVPGENAPGVTWRQ